MKMYHYVKKGNTVLQDGLLSFATSHSVNTRDYLKRTGFDDKQQIIEWMENCFVGRSRGIRFFTESIKWHNEALCLKRFVDAADLFSIDIHQLAKDGLIESVWESPSVLDKPNYEHGEDEILDRLNSIDEIDFSPVGWNICNDELGRRFAFVRYYLIVTKNGIIPPQYITKE